MSKEKNELSVSNNIKHQVKNRVNLVDKELVVLQWPNLFSVEPTSNYSNGCFPDRWGAVCNGVQTSRQWSEEERTLHINVLELLAIRLALFSFTKGKRVKGLHFQIDNKAVLPYLLKMGGTKNKHMIILSKEIRHYLLNHNMAITVEYLPEYSTEYSSTVGDRESRKKNRLFRVTSSSQSFSSGFLTTRFSDKRSICFRPMQPTTSIYSLASRSLQPGDRCNDTNL